MHVAFTKMKSVLTGILFFIVFRCVQMKIHYITFPSEISRATVFEPQVVLKSCMLKPGPGPCRGSITMYFFKPETLKCETFLWGGCQGNGNRFDTEEECTSTCLSRPDTKSKRPRYCNLSYDYGFCFGSMTRWYYDHLWKVCKHNIYSGCGGNKNNFHSKEQCESICRLGTGVIRNPTKKTGAMKKVLIVNPLNIKSARGQVQTAATTAKTRHNPAAGK